MRPIENLDLREAILCSLGIHELTESKEFTAGTERDETNVFNMLIVYEDAVFSHCGKWLTRNAESYIDLAAAGHILEEVEVPKKTIMYGFFQDIELESGKVEAVSLARTLE